VYVHGVVSFLGEPPRTAAAMRAYEADLESDGYVGNLTRVWCWRPDVLEAFTSLRALLTGASTLDARDCAILVAAAASALGDSYCALAWGTRLASLTDERTAAKVLRGETQGLDDRGRALARWAGQVARDPGATAAADVDSLRSVGLDDRAIFEATALVALRVAFAAVNDSLGAAPDVQLAEEAPRAVREAVTYGRAPA